MSTKRKTYSAEFKAKVVLEVLEAELETVKKEKDLIAKKLGETIVEKEFLEGKLKSLVSSKSRKTFVDSKHELSINKQCKLLHIAKSTLYYTPVKKFSSDEDIKLLNKLNEIHSEFPYYGTRRLVTALANEGFKIGRKLVKTAMEYIGIKALYPKHKTTQAYKEHYKYKYLLKEFKNDKNQVIIDTPNRVWSTDITYIKLEKGYVYLSAIIDWHSKKILSWKLSNTMDVKLTTDVLKEALMLYPKPEIFNSDQGSQYTAKEHIKILQEHDIKISLRDSGEQLNMRRYI